MVELMETLGDDDLARQVRGGREEAFTILIRRYERSLAALIRSRLGAESAVEDVLQETLVHAWLGLGAGQPRNVRGWLYQVARNRCSDYLRARQRRERPTDDDTLAVMVNRQGVADARRRRVAAEVVEAFEEMPDRERQALQAFYVDGFSVREIAARHACAPGTIKRRLSHGRDRVRGELGIAIRRADMNTNSTKQHPFPTERPRIVIEERDAEASPIDMRELIWWFVVPELGDDVCQAEYQPIQGGGQWRLTVTTAFKAQRPAVLHDRECVEIEVDERSYPVDGVLDPNAGHRRTKVWGRLTESEIEWLGIEELAADGTRRLYTFLDEVFEADFGSCPRRIEVSDGLALGAEGHLDRQPGTPERFASGVFDVTIGDTTVVCTRVVELEEGATELDVVIVAYVDETGRTVLFRRYDGNRRVGTDESRSRQALLPHADCLVVNGMTFVHSFDYLSDRVGVGTRATSPRAVT